MTPLTVSRPPAATGMVWIKEGWRLFMLAPIPWTGMTALVFLVLMAVSMLPVVGVLAVHVLSPFIVAGYLAASRGGSAGETISFIYLGAGWREGRHSLLVIGAIYMLATLLIFTGLIARRLAQGRHPPCACFGAWSAKPLGPGHLVRNGVLIVLAVVTIAA